MPMKVPDAPSIATVRGRIAQLLDRETETGQRRSIIILAIDGIGFDLARRVWTGAHHDRLASVFPPTSSSAWLTSLTGLDVDTHGIAGVMVRLPERGNEPVNLARDAGPIEIPPAENIFSDAARRGYRPIAIAGDLDEYDGCWRDALLRHTQKIEGGRFCAGPAASAHGDAGTVSGQIEIAVRSALPCKPSDPPVMIWCFVDLDRIIHVRGYDGFILNVLALIDGVAVRLASEGAVVVGHSDHGLVRTSHDPLLAQLIEDIAGSDSLGMGGAGRVRWLYPKEGTAVPLFERLRAGLPATVAVATRDDFFRPGSLAYRRVGEILLLAEGEKFVAPPGYLYDHGSWIDEEIYVPFSQWDGRALDRVS